MIDKARRTALADRIHEYVIGLHTNYEFERLLHEIDRPVFAESQPDDDPVLSPMLERMWCFCFVHGDLDEYRLTGDYGISKKARHEVLRWVLFLRSGMEYEWPVFQLTSQMHRDAGIIHPLLSLFTFGAWGRIQHRNFNAKVKQFESAGDHDVWPFKRRSDFLESYKSACPLTID